MRNFAVGFIFLIICGCGKHDPQPLFTDIATEGNLFFENTLTYTEEFNPYTYRNFYNGGGVALGDINNDGLLDIYFTGNIVDNKLFLNSGNWVFEDITAKAGVACSGAWSSGATFVDINGDGFLDIYVCKSGNPEGENRHNELFINNGDFTFSEQSKAYGLDIIGLSTHAAFFDYDKDGDLDCYLLTNSIRSVGGYDLIEGQRNIPDPDGGGNKFFRNDNGRFVDVSLDHGIYHSTIGFGLGITLSDFNDDGWTDIFISNDFFERDYLYINNQGKSFTESLESYFASVSMGSMGADAADLDNNGKRDLFVTEMLPATIERRRTKAVFESWDKYELSVSKGYFHQFPRNVLQQNIGGKFLEVGRFANVAATDWSWGALLFDMDNDGQKDIFVSNGIYKDLLDRDYLTYMANDTEVKRILEKKGAVIKELIDIMPSEAVPNFAFRNKGGFEFENSTDLWGFGLPSFSNGSAYGDLDNDGDLDLVINNVNMPSFVYRNNSDTASMRSIRIKLSGQGQNTMGIGAVVRAYSNGYQFLIENYPSRGFQSSVDPVLHIGLGGVKALDSISVQWQSGRKSTLYNIATNALVEFSEKDAAMELGVRSTDATLLPLKLTEIGIPFRHQENHFVDFDRDRLLPHMLHNDGPALSVGDVNGDGLDDVYIGGAKDQAGMVFLQTQNGTFQEQPNKVFADDKLSEDVASIFFDADNDGDLDLYVASGGREYSKSSSALADRLYINEGGGNFTKAENSLPFVEFFSTSAVANYDFDGDGDQDLYVGERFHPFYYSTKVRGYLLENDGSGNFKDVTQAIAPELLSMDMITDATWADMDGDGAVDLVIACEWGPIKVMINKNGQFKDASKSFGMAEHTGWWRSISIADYNGDGKPDILAGNHGSNSFFKDGTRMYVHDFDQNGTLDYIFAVERAGKYYPVADRNELTAQMPKLKKKLLFFKDYAAMSVEDIFSPDEIAKAEMYEARTLTSGVFLNKGGKFEWAKFDNLLQYGPIYDIHSDDINDDGRQDHIFGGNQYLVKPQFGRYDALPLTVLMGAGIAEGIKPTPIPMVDQIRNIRTIRIGGRKHILIGINNSNILLYEQTGS